MTTITIKKGLRKKNYVYNTPIQAIEDILNEMGIILLQPIENPEILERVKNHHKENKNRSLDSYDDI